MLVVVDELCADAELLEGGLVWQHAVACDISSETIYSGRGYDVGICRVLFVELENLVHRIVCIERHVIESATLNTCRLDVERTRDGDVCRLVFADFLYEVYGDVEFVYAELLELSRRYGQQYVATIVVLRAIFDIVVFEER